LELFKGHKGKFVLGDELASADKPIDDDELISYIFVGLDYEYNLVVTTLLGKEVLTIGYIYSQLLHFEQCLTLETTTGEHNSMDANHGRGTTHGRGGPRGGGCSQSMSRGTGRGAGHLSTRCGNCNN
jgi:hypothetical protein